MTQVQSASINTDISRLTSVKDVRVGYACNLVELQSRVSKGCVGRVVKKRTSVVGCDGIEVRVGQSGSKVAVVTAVRKAEVSCESRV